MTKFGSASFFLMVFGFGIRQIDDVDGRNAGITPLRFARRPALDLHAGESFVRSVIGIPIEVRIDQNRPNKSCFINAGLLCKPFCAKIRPVTMTAPTPAAFPDRKGRLLAICAKDRPRPIANHLFSLPRGAASSVAGSWLWKS